MSTSPEISEDIKAKTKILIADDQTDARNIVSSVLIGLGFVNIFQSENGLKTIEIVQKRDMDLIICDWNMPGASGLEVLRNVRASKSVDECVFMMLTAQAFSENVKQAVSSGVSLYLAKPFTTTSLTEAVVSCLPSLEKIVTKRK